MVKKIIESSSLEIVMGPLWKLYSAETSREIFIDSYDDVYCFTNDGVISDAPFKTSKDLDLFISRLLKHSKKEISPEGFSCFFQLDDLTRVSLVLPPIAIKGPSLVITKIPKKQISLDDLVTYKALDLEGKKRLEDILNSNKGFVVAGNMGSGKTTLLNTLVNSLPAPKRVVTLERIPSLIINRSKVCRLQSQTQKAIEMVELVGVAEQMRADYVVLSECVGPEVGPFIEMVRSNCAGIALTTGENVFDSIKRLITKTVLSSDGFSLEEASYALAQAFGYVIFQEKREDGKRVVSSISETNYSDGEIVLKVIYKR